MTDRVVLRDGFGIPMIGFGTYLDVGEEAIYSALMAGYRHIDTAEYYQNESDVGNAIRKSGIPRSEIFVTTKLAPGGFGTPFKGFQETIESFEKSIEKLQLEYVDLYLIHHAFAKNERIDQWRALVEIQKSGRIRSIGVSNWNIKHIEEIRDAGLPLPVVNQIEIHPMCTQTALVEFLRINEILPVAYSSLAPLSSWRADAPGKSSKTEEDLATDATIARIAAELGVSEARLLLRWGLQHGYPVLPKSTNDSRIRSNLDLLSFSIIESFMADLDSLDRNRCFAWPSGNPLDCE
jgi:2,5-diketo-D-gluconate reductase A